MKPSPESDRSARRIYRVFDLPTEALGCECVLVPAGLPWAPGYRCIVCESEPSERSVLMPALSTLPQAEQRMIEPKEESVYNLFPSNIIQKGLDVQMKDSLRPLKG